MKIALDYGKDVWKLIDGECYYFYSDGSLAINTITPDGYKVDETCAWVL